MKTNSAEQVGQSRKYGQNDPPDQANSSKRQRLSDTTSATDKLQNDLNNKDKKIAQLETLLLLLTREPSLEQFYSKVSTTEMEKNQTNQEKVSKLEQLNSLLNAKNTAITGRIQMLESQNNTYAIELNQKTVLVEQQAAEIQQIRSEYALKLKESEAARETNCPNSDYVNSLEARIQKHLLEFKELQNSLDLCKAELSNQTSENSVLQEQNQLLVEKSSGLETKSTDLESQLKAITDEHSNLKKQYDDKLKNITELKISKNKIESRMVALRAQNFKLEDKQKSNDVQINNLKVINEDLDNQLRASHAKNAELEKQQQNNPKRTEELETVIKNLRSKLKVVNAKLSTGVNQNQHFLMTVGQLSESTINLEKRFKLAIETLTELQEYRQKSMESAAQLETANKNLQNMLDETKTKLLESEKKNQHYMRMQGTSENEATTSEQRDPDSTQSPQKAQDPLNEAILKYIENGREQVKKIKSDAIEMSSSQNEQKHCVVSELSELLQKYKSDAAAARRDKQFEPALKFIYTAIGIDQSWEYSKEHTSSLWRMASGISYEMNNFPIAIKCLDTAVKFDSNGYINYYKRASLYYNLKQYKQAKEDVEATLALKPDFVKAQKLSSEVDDKLNYLNSLKH